MFSISLPLFISPLPRLHNLLSFRTWIKATHWKTQTVSSKVGFSSVRSQTWNLRLMTFDSWFSLTVQPDWQPLLVHVLALTFSTGASSREWGWWAERGKRQVREPGVLKERRTVCFTSLLLVFSPHMAFGLGLHTWKLQENNSSSWRGVNT